MPICANFSEAKSSLALNCPLIARLMALFVDHCKHLDRIVDRVLNKRPGGEGGARHENSAVEETSHKDCKTFRT